MKCPSCGNEFDVQPEKVSMYDPVVDAHREVSVEKARKMIESADAVRKIVEEASGTNATVVKAG